MKTSFFILLLALVGCADLPKPIDPVLAPPTETVNIPDELLLTCPAIPKLESRDYKEGELVKITNKIITISENCRTKDSILINTVVKAFNIKPKVEASK